MGSRGYVQYNKGLEKIREEKTLSETTKETIIKFLEEKKSRKISARRLVSLIRQLIFYAKIKGTDLKEIDEEDFREHKNIFYFENALAKIKNSKKISKHSKSLILKFIENKKSENIKIKRLSAIAGILLFYAEHINKDLDKVTEEDIRNFILWLNEAKKIRGGEKYSEASKNTIKVCLANFYKYLNDGELPRSYKFLKESNNKSNKKLPEDIWTEEEINKLINSTRDPFWKAFISLGYESGARLGELLNMRIKDVKFTDFGARIRLDGKTGVREIPVIKCIPYLATYLKLHPYNNNTEAWLWIKTNGEKISEEGVRFQLEKFVKKLGIKKKCNPHLLFRHSRATQLANYLTESQLKQYFGWTQDSRMASTYIHLSGRDIDNAVLGIYGMVKKKEEEIQNGLPIKCYRCGFPNEPNSKFCGNCGLPLDTKTAIEEERKIDKLSRIGNELLEKKD